MITNASIGPSGRPFFEAQTLEALKIASFEDIKSD
jgi:hypothetical protein